MVQFIRIVASASVGVWLLTSGGLAADGSAPVALTVAQIKAFSPKARPEIVAVLLERQDVLTDAGITTDLRLAHFLAQVAVETGGLRLLAESMNYSEESLLKVFSRKRVPPEKAKELAALQPRSEKERTIANWVYGDRLGNGGQHTDDGWNYRGSGFLQLTGRANFRDRSKAVGLPLEDEPELARRPVEGLLAAAAYWRSRDLNGAADDDDLKRARILVNGPAAHGYGQAKIWLARAKQILKVGGGTGTEAGALVAGAEEDGVARALEDIGLLRPGARESGGAAQGQAIEEALREFQRSRGLPESGKLDDDTLYELSDPEEWRGDVAEQVTQAVAAPDEGVTFELQTGAVREDRPAGGTGGGTESGSMEPVPALPDAATGSGQLAANPLIPPQELTRLADLKAAYAPYEVAEGRRDPSGGFIQYSIIGGSDERSVVLDTTAFPARAVVQILFTSAEDGKVEGCSGAMISPRTVLTAGHCVHSGTTAGRWHTGFEVYPGRNGATAPNGRCGVRRLHALQGWTGAGSQDESRYYDLGAITLDCDVGSSTGWFRLRAVEGGALPSVVVVQGYPVDKTPGGRQWSSKGSVRVVQELNLFYDDDTFGGMSGSPVLAAGVPEIVAVHTNGLHNGEPWSTWNGSTRLTAERLQMIARWIAQ